MEEWRGHIDVEVAVVGGSSRIERWSCLHSFLNFIKVFGPTTRFARFHFLLPFPLNNLDSVLSLHIPPQPWQP